VVRILADLGVDVIKIEPPGGDRWREYGPFFREQKDPERVLNGLLIILVNEVSA